MFRQLESPSLLLHVGYIVSTLIFTVCDIQFPTLSQTVYLSFCFLFSSLNVYVCFASFPLFDNVAYAPDGILEAIEMKDKKFIIGVQWHPEGLDDENSNKLFDYFINTCKN